MPDFNTEVAEIAKITEKNRVAPKARALRGLRALRDLRAKPERNARQGPRGGGIAIASIVCPVLGRS